MRQIKGKDSDENEWKRIAYLRVLSHNERHSTRRLNYFRTKCSFYVAVLGMSFFLVHFPVVLSVQIVPCSIQARTSTCAPESPEKFVRPFPCICDCVWGLVWQQDACRMGKLRWKSRASIANRKALQRALQVFWVEGQRTRLRRLFGFGTSAHCTCTVCSLSPSLSSFCFWPE